MRIVIADDDHFSRQLLAGILQRLGHDVVACADGSTALAALQAADAPRLAILDWMMPGLSGLELCRALRASVAHYCYVMLVTSRDSRADLLEAFEAEVDDVVAKPVDPSELRLRLRAGERVLALQERLLQAQERLRDEASHDVLTGLSNRRAIVERLTAELNRVRHGGPPLTVLLADLDHFKAINDTHSHLAGDAVLREAAQRIASALRLSDAAGRYGGEEFLILAPGADAEGAAILGERVRRAVAETPFRAAAGVDLRCSVSIGSATIVHGLLAEEVLQQADDALYRAKAAGRNRVVAASAWSAPDGASAPTRGG